MLHPKHKKRRLHESNARDYSRITLAIIFCLYPDEFDGPATAYQPGTDDFGVELHAAYFSL